MIGGISWSIIVGAVRMWRGEWVAESLLSPRQAHNDQLRWDVGRVNEICSTYVGKVPTKPYTVCLESRDEGFREIVAWALDLLGARVYLNSAVLTHPWRYFLRRQ